ncbi:YggN family protein [Aestuariibacter sp. AA17]|uniref:YggN family protein n=1 Tax=Fluctibacter corallii TaxID=2984329 RepID=A0ABT3A892_9ALTE|nr:YggN family protein [Aestuariibacter sp. AA17]MCV2884807.1 YggN family protein [Aestuariibacter sp. AA17]
MFRSLFTLLLCLVSINAAADLKCNVDLKYGLVVNDDHIRVIDETRTVYQINNRQQLIVQGEWIQLDPRQQADLESFAEGIHYVVPKMIILASEGVELAVDTIEHVYVGLVGTEHNSYAKIQRSLERVEKRIKERFIHASDNYYIGPGKLENVDDLVDKELEEQLEQAINTSLGGVLSAIGGLASDGTAEQEQRIEALTERLESVGQEIERHVGTKAEKLRHKAKWFCNKMHYLDRVEDNLRDKVPEMKKFNVIRSGKQAQLTR